MKIITRGFANLIITRGFGITSDLREIITFDSELKREVEWKTRLIS